MKIKYFWKPLLWLALICYGLFTPAKELPIKPFLNIPHFDKMVHFSLFFVLCLLLFNPFKKIQLKFYFFAPFTSLFLGAILEISQHFISKSRHTDFYDFLANSAGVLVAILFYYLFVSEKKWEKLF